MMESGDGDMPMANADAAVKEEKPTTKRGLKRLATTAMRKEDDFKRKFYRHERAVSFLAAITGAFNSIGDSPAWYRSTVTDPTGQSLRR